MMKIQEIDKVAFEKQVIDKFLGLPYVNKGRGPEGIDCWGLILGVYEMTGFKLFDIPTIDYSKDWAKSGGNYLAENLWREWQPVDDPKFLDGVLFVNMEGVAHHGGVILSEGKFIHATKYGVIVSKFTDAFFKERIQGFYRLKNLYV